LTVAIPELSPWLIVFDLLGIALAVLYNRPAIPFFAVSLLVCLWPLAQVRGVERATDRQFHKRAPGSRAAPFSVLDSFRVIRSSDLRPEILPLNIHFYHSQAALPSAILIDIYGGAWQRGSPGDNRRFDSYMASRGYAVFAIDYRHAPGAQFPAQLEDVRDAVSFIRSNAGRYNADPDRIAICGRSAGAQLALLSGYEKGPAAVKAVISFYGPTDLTLGYSDLPFPDPLDVRSILRSYIGGPPSQFPERYRAASPIDTVRENLPVTLLIQGARDHIVKPIFARELHRKLIESGNRAVLLELPWAEHAFDAIFSGIGSQLSLFYIEQFLNEVVGSRSVPDADLR
jgi:acetyl esterase/lipase